MTYRTYIFWKTLWWDIRKNEFRFWASAFQTFFQPKKYNAWLKHEICAIYRRRTLEGQAFSKSFDGLPKLTDKIPPQKTWQK